jgi:hypothetical protein
MQGHATVDGQGSSSITAIKVGMGDAYEAPGSTDFGNANGGYTTFDGHWGSYNQIPFEGTQTLYATAIAADGTRATANLTLTLNPKYLPNLQALGVVYDWRVGTTGMLQATISDRGPAFGTSIDFYVGSERVCSATISGPELPTDTTGYARCRDPLAISKAIAAGGYEARYEGNEYTLPASDTAGVIERQSS